MRARAFALSVVCCAMALPVSGQNTAFTYQGSLERTGEPVDGVCDLRVSLYRGSQGGTALETDILDDVEIDRGRFHVEVDFGEIFDAEELWVGVSVACPAGSGEFTVLTPRQRLAATPFALFAHRAGEVRWGDLTNVPAGFADGVDTDTTYGAGLGLRLEGPTFRVATDIIQRRVGGICPVGRYIRAIDEDGNVQCGIDADSGGDITSIIAGPGLSGSTESGAASLEVTLDDNGTSTKVSRGDHDHVGQNWTVSGPFGLRIENGDAAGALGAAQSAAATVSGIPGGLTAGVVGSNSGPNGFGVIGTVTGSGGVGMKGESYSSSGVGVQGGALNPVGRSFGVQGLSNSNAGVGVLGQAVAETAAADAVPVGVRGESTVGIGVVGSTTSGGGIGVAGSGFVGVAGDSEASSGRGLSGRVTHEIGTAVGVYGEAASPSGFGGSFTNLADLGPGLRASSGPGGLDIVLGSNGTGGPTDDGVISTDPTRVQSDLMLLSYDDVEIHLNQDGGVETSVFYIRDGADDAVFRVTNTGQVFADGTFHAGGADFAELLPAESGLEAGDVVVIGSSGDLERSSAPFQTNVAGVYSARPGMLGGAGTINDTPDSIPLAVLGVVTVKASAENGAIRPGDLLTTATAAGRAMRCAGVAQCAGATIGKALDPLEGGVGAIEMLVSLH